MLFSHLLIISVLKRQNLLDSVVILFYFDHFVEQQLHIHDGTTAGCQCLVHGHFDM